MAVWLTVEEDEEGEDENDDDDKKEEETEVAAVEGEEGIFVLSIASALKRACAPQVAGCH